MIEYIQSLLKRQHHTMVYNLMYEFQTFVVDVINQEVIVLRPDLAKEYAEFIETAKRERYDIKLGMSSQRLNA